MASKKILILDTNAFIRCLNLQALSQEYEVFTIEEVLYEIRDKRAKDKFMTIAFDIKTVRPDDKAINFVSEFSKMTGDYTTLSEVDREVIAAAVTLAYQKGKAGLLRKNPPQMTQWIPKSSYNQQSEYVEVKSNQKQAEASEVPASNQKGENDSNNKEEKKTDESNTVAHEPKTESQTVTQSAVEGTEAANVDNSKSTKVEDSAQTTTDQPKTTEEASKVQASKPKKNDSDDEGGWITPSNIQKHFYKSEKTNETLEEMGIAIMTTDFAMQNVIIQMNIPLLSAEGMIIKQTKRWVLECGGCLNICKVMDKQFCPKCGNPTLFKLSVRANNDGTMTCFRKKDKVFNNRGKIYSIPKTKQGRHADNLVLREDELLMNGKVKQIQQAQKQQEKKMNQVISEYDNGFGFDVMRKDLSKGHGIKFGYGRMNPNDAGQMKKHNFNR